MKHKSTITWWPVLNTRGELVGQTSEPVQRRGEIMVAVDFTIEGDPVNAFACKVSRNTRLARSRKMDGAPIVYWDTSRSHYCIEQL